jgi:putative transposase
MPRTSRSLVPHGYYHLINRGNNRASVFLEPADYRRFIGLMERSQERVQLRLLAYCLMPNHFHLVASQDGQRDISRWMHWLLTTHSHRHHLQFGSSGRVWQGRFKAFPIERDGHLLTVMRYVERNALRAGLVERAEEWAWGSLAWRRTGSVDALLAEPPLTLPSDWTQRVNAPQSVEELAALRSCVNGQQPFGDDAWVEDQSLRIGLGSAVRPRGRPRKPVLPARQKQVKNR